MNADTDADAPLLDDNERARAERMRDAEGRRRFVRAHTVLREVLAEATGVTAGHVEFLRAPCAACGEPHGKPYVDGGPRFSLSRSGPWAVIAVSEVEVGVDVEVRRELGILPADLLAPGETSDDPLRTWVRKEALLKATGVGLTRTMSTVRADDARIVDLELPHGLVGALAFTDASPSSTRVHAR